jgi:hypothetical protein
MCQNFQFDEPKSRKSVPSFHPSFSFVSILRHSDASRCIISLSFFQAKSLSQFLNDIASYNISAIGTAAFSGAFAGGASDSAKQAFADLFGALGGNTSLIRPALDSTTAVMSVISPNPTEAQKLQIIQKTQVLFADRLNIPKSVPGFENFFTDPKFLNDPANAEYFANVQATKVAVQQMSTNPAYAYTYFNDPQTPISFSRALVLFSEIVTREVTRSSQSSYIKIETEK